MNVLYIRHNVKSFWILLLRQDADCCLGRLVLSGTLPIIVLDAIKGASLPLRGPFAGILPNTLEKRLARAILRLHQSGDVQAAYSSYSLRHFYAIQEYRRGVGEVD
jgi:hypothetical protein